ncbi:hypothetical protein ACE101_01150 [Methylobacterium sp. ID0610]
MGELDAASIRTLTLVRVPESLMSRVIYSRTFEEQLLPWLADRPQWDGYLEPMHSADDDEIWFLTCPSEADAVEFRVRWL